MVNIDILENGNICYMISTQNEVSMGQNWEWNKVP